MIDLQALGQFEPFQLSPTEKSKVLLEGLNELVDHHRMNSDAYFRICNAFGLAEGFSSKYEDLPFLPVQLFKSVDLRSVPIDRVTRTMTSSGTTSQSRSQVYVDSTTGNRQRRALAHIVGDLLGKRRIPMIVVDSPATAAGMGGYSARTAGIQGFSVFSRDRCFALNDSMELELDKVKEFIQDHADQKIFVFGFTSIIWLHLINELQTLHETLSIPDGILIHGGGWKKIEQMSVSSEDFKKETRRLTGVSSVHDYYGMVEQTGSIYIECESGKLHSSIYSEVIVRRPHDLSVADDGETGLIQTMSLLPLSYPGHVLLTEDLGTVVGRDGCECGRRGTHFVVHGRLKNSEARGCSDTYQLG